ncbi:hypothetical protein, partial [Clostridioides difficile]|uniref:hypothetical protein n=1 Tax=Clostridioides difficile TaxID=1496 RepID=UPI001A943A03
ECLKIDFLVHEAFFCMKLNIFSSFQQEKEASLYFETASLLVFYLIHNIIRTNSIDVDFL